MKTINRIQTFQEFDNDNGEILHIIITEAKNGWRIEKNIDGFSDWEEIIENFNVACTIFDEFIDDAKNDGWRKR